LSRIEEFNLGTALVWRLLNMGTKATIPAGENMNKIQATTCQLPVVLNILTIYTFDA